MVGGEILSKALVTSGGSWPKSSTYPGSHSGRMTLRRFEQGRFAASQIFFEVFTDNLILKTDWFFPSFCLWFGKTFEPFEDSDGVFAVTSIGSSEFIQDGGFFMTRGIFIP